MSGDKSIAGDNNIAGAKSSVNLGGSIVKNASVLMISQLITWSLAILLTIFMPRYLGPAAIGGFQLASSIWAIVTIFVTFGMDTMLTKEIARSPERINQLLGTSLALRALLFVVGVPIVGFFTRWVGYPMETVYLILIVGIANIGVQFSMVFSAALQGLERMEFVSLGDIISKAFITIVTVALLLAGYGVVPAALVLIGGAVISALVQFLALRRLQPLKFKPEWSISRWMLTTSLPYLLIVGIRTVYVQIDVILISLLVNQVVLGWYSVASRLFATFLFIPSVVMTAVFPVLSRMHAASPDSLQALIRKNFDLMLLFGIPIGIGLFVIADPLVILLFGPEFAKSGIVLAIMGLVIPFTYQNTLIGYFLISTDRQAIWTRVMAVATIITVPLDLLLIPFFQIQFNNGAIGGSVSFLITEAGMMILGLFLVPRGTFNRATAWTATRVILAGLVMGAAIWFVRDAFIIIPVAAGAVIYVGLIVLFRVISNEDWTFFKSFAQGVLSRFHKSSSAPSRA